MMSKGNSPREDPCSTNGHLESKTSQSFRDTECTMEHLMYSFPHSILMSMVLELGATLISLGWHSVWEAEHIRCSMQLPWEGQMHFHFSGPGPGGRTWLPSVMAVAQGAEGRDGHLRQNTINQAENSQEHQDSHLQKEPCDILWSWHIHFCILKNKVASARGLVLSNLNKPSLWHEGKNYIFVIGING